MDVTPANVLENLERLTAEIQQLRAAGRSVEADQMEQRVQTMAMIATGEIEDDVGGGGFGGGFGGGGGGGDGGGLRVTPENVMEHLPVIQQQIQQMRQMGRTEEAEDLQRKVEAMMGQNEQPRGGGGGGFPGGFPGGGFPGMQGASGGFPGMSGASGDFGLGDDLDSQEERPRLKSIPIIRSRLIEDPHALSEVRQMYDVLRKEKASFDEIAEARRKQQTIDTKVYVDNATMKMKETIKQEATLRKGRLVKFLATGGLHPVLQAACQRGIGDCDATLKKEAMEERRRAQARAAEEQELAFKSDPLYTLTEFYHPKDEPIPPEEVTLQEAKDKHDPGEYQFAFSEVVLALDTFGTVYLGRDVKNNAPVAVKKYPLDDPVVMQEALDNLETWKSIRHPNIVSSVGAASVRNELFVFMEFCGTVTLESLLSAGAGFPKNLVAEYAKQVLEGLAFLHEHKLEHMNVKPSNVVLCEGVCKLTDFAPVSITKTTSTSQFVCGARVFLPPEIIAGEPVSSKCDIYSYGITFIQISGWQAFPSLSARPSLTEVARAILTGPTLPPAHFGAAGYREAMERCLSRDPAARATAAELLALPFYMA
eukprot:TRINITY_DN1640_c0_g1_i1.p1 TRINITY_DN1640_c0_g1~~TRINITY_DN1640_c0_g1_i1.p1  ORF type:complete len:594 (-),score=111.20 TRINITY_DN1640_c0_g1_i1:71-1852(-)